MELLLFMGDKLIGSVAPAVGALPSKAAAPASTPPVLISRLRLVVVNPCERWLIRVVISFSFSASDRQAPLCLPPSEGEGSRLDQDWLK